MTGVVVAHEPPLTTGDLPLGQGGRRWLERSLPSPPGDLEEQEEGGHDKAGMGNGDDGLLRTLVGKALLCRLDPHKELIPAFTARSKGAGGCGLRIELTVACAVLRPREAIGNCRDAVRAGRCQW